MSANRVVIDPDIGIPDLVRQLGDDSRRLVEDEVRLARIEVKESVRRAGKGAMWLGVAFGVGVVALVALTLLLVTLIGRLASGHMWVGALVTGIIELAVAMLLFRRGASALREPSYSLEETRTEVRETARWVANPR